MISKLNHVFTTGGEGGKHLEGYFVDWWARSSQPLGPMPCPTMNIRGDGDLKLAVRRPLTVLVNKGKKVVPDTGVGKCV